MVREQYVDETGVEVNQKERDKKAVMRALIAIMCVVCIIIIYFVFRSIIKRNHCHKIIDTVSTSSLSYAKEEDILPRVEGDYITFSLDVLLNRKYITEEDITVNKKVATGNIKITKYKKEYITTVELKDCDYCDSSKKSWSKEVSKRSNKKVIDVIAYYNYYHKSTNSTNWTSWYTNDKIENTVSKEYQIRLPNSKNLLPKIADDAEIISIEQETKEYYRYRDKRWKFYRGGGNYTDYFSSEQPEGYTNYDSSTLIYTDWSKYSLTYPEEKSYREIQKTTGYKWYIEKDGKKEYYKSGDYFVNTEVPDAYKRDSKQSAPMYRYRDKMWRWYSGEKRTYSGYFSTMPKGFTNRDDGIYNYSGYSNWSETSSLNANTISYREEESDTRYRYRTHYHVYSLAVLDKPVTKDELEKKLEMSIDDIFKRDDLKIDISYKFRYKK